MKSTKKIYLEFIRIIALICIIFNHTGERGNQVYLSTAGDVTFVFSLIADILCRMGVPLFLMVSGALLLYKEENWENIYKRRIVRIIKVIVIFTALRYSYECFYKKSMTFSIIALLKTILAGNIFAPYWFLYVYLAMLIVLPFVKKMVKNLDKKEMDVLTSLILLFYVLFPLISSVWGIHINISFLISLNCCYCILGYYMEHLIKKEAYTRKNVFYATMILCASVLFSYWLVVKDRNVSGIIRAEYVSSLTIIIAMIMFFLVKAFWVKYEEKINDSYVSSFIIKIGTCSFGIYLIEDYLRNGLVFIYEKMAPHITILPACAVWMLVVLMVGIVVVSVLKKIPILKDVL